MAQPRKNAFVLFLLPNSLKVISSNKAAKQMRMNIKSIGKRVYWYIFPIIGFVSLLRSKLGSSTNTFPFEICNAGSYIIILKVGGTDSKNYTDDGSYNKFYLSCI